MNTVHRITIFHVLGSLTLRNLVILGDEKDFGRTWFREGRVWRKQLQLKDRRHGGAIFSNTSNVRFRRYSNCFSSGVTSVVSLEQSWN